MTDQEIESLKKGDKIIFMEDGGVLMTIQFGVFTFSNWHNNDSFFGKHWQCEELLNQGNKEHNFSIRNCEVFNPEIHKEFILMTNEKLDEIEKDFVKRFGA